MIDRTAVVSAAVTALMVGIVVALIALALYTLFGPPEAPFWIHDGVLIGAFSFVASLLDSRRRKKADA